MASTGWRALHIDSGMEIRLSLGQIKGVRDGQKYSLPLEDLTLIIVETGVHLTSDLLAACLERGVPVLFCDDKKMPQGFLLNFTNHSRNSAIAHEQIAMPKHFKNKLWQCIIKQKILNQAQCLKKADRPVWVELDAMAAQVESGDFSYKESQAARLYFPALFGEDFTRKNHRKRGADKINAALNYTYTIVRARLATTIVGAGLLPQFGVFHKNAQNPFNLADDLLEPFRPIVDSYVFELDLSDEEFTKSERALLLEILQQNVTIAKETRGFISAIEQVVEGFVRAMTTGKYKNLLLPVDSV